MIHVNKGLIEKDGKILVLLREDIAYWFPSHWDFPGGTQEENETPEETIIRETKEELQITCTVEKKLADFVLNCASSAGDSEDIHFTIFKLNPESFELKLSWEHVEYRWATIEEVKKLKCEPYLVKFMEENGI